MFKRQLLAGAIGAIAVFSGALPSLASADTGGYPQWNMPCSHPPYLTTGTCPNYDWGPVRNGAVSTTYSSRGYGYRNCTDWVAWRLQQLGIPDSKTRGLGNGGQWADFAPGKGIPVSATPQAGDAAVRVGNPGHVAFVESVSGGTITVSQYNAAGTGTYSVQTGTAGALGFQKFVHFGAHPTGPSGYGEGSFIQVAGHPEVYRIAGGAPIYVSSWNGFGGAKPVTAISQGQFDALRSVPADGTFISSNADGRVYVIAGGAPIYVSSWAGVGGPKSAMAVDQWSIDHPGDPHAHLRQYPADGTFVNTTQDGRVYVIAGGAPLYVSNWAAYGGARSSVRIDQWAVDNPQDPHAHLRSLPADGTLVSSTADGRVYEIAGGAPLYVSNWAAIGGPRPAVGVDQWAIDNPQDPHAHLRQYPASGTLISSSGDGRVYTVAGGAPIYVSNWGAIGGARPAVGVDQWAIDNPDDPHAHLRRYPADGTFVNTVKGHVYSFAGGAAFLVTDWKYFGTVWPTTRIDYWALQNRGDPHAHIRPSPSNGTVVLALPSQHLWKFRSGYRVRLHGSKAWDAPVDEHGLAAYPRKQHNH